MSPSTASHWDCRSPPLHAELGGDLEPTRLLLCPTIRPRQVAHGACTGHGTARPVQGDGHLDTNTTKAATAQHITGLNLGSATSLPAD